MSCDVTLTRLNLFRCINEFECQMSLLENCVVHRQANITLSAQTLKCIQHPRITLWGKALDECDGVTVDDIECAYSQQGQDLFEAAGLLGFRDIYS